MTGWLALDVFTPPPTLLLTMGALNTLLSPTFDPPITCGQRKNSVSYSLTHLGTGRIHRFHMMVCGFPGAIVSSSHCPARSLIREKVSRTMKTHFCSVVSFFSSETNCFLTLAVFCIAWFCWFYFLVLYFEIDCF